MIIELDAKTDVGRIRAGNEDNFLVLDVSSAEAWVGSDGALPPRNLNRFDLGPKGLVLLVSDGMGGALAGDVASRMAVETVRDKLIEGEASSTNGNNNSGLPLINILSNAVDEANHLIHQRSLEDARCSGMGATLTGAAVTPEGLGLVQVGDSRGYVIRGGEIKLVTKDQSLVQQLIDVGQITELEAETHMFRNVILQALGAQPELAPVTGSVRMRHGDILLLCSDGLSGKLRAEEIWQLVTAADGDLGLACDSLIREANERGGEDNITVVVAKFTGDDLPAPTSNQILVLASPLGEEDVTLQPEDTSPKSAEP